MFFKKKTESDIQIVGCPRTRITTETFCRVIEEFEKLPKGKFVFNLGNGNWQGQEKYERDGYTIINRVENIKNCSNKKRMFRILSDKNVSCLTYFDLEVSSDVSKAREYINKGGIICLRRRKKLTRIKTLDEFNRIYRNYQYATGQENKRFEYRIVMLQDEPVVIYVKNPSRHVFKYKQEYCTFGRITLPKNSNILKVCKESTKALGIDMCGIDILVNTKGEAKIIEVNSGNGMAGRTVKKIMKMLR